MTNVTIQDQQQKLKVSDLTTEQLKKYQEFLYKQCFSWFTFEGNAEKLNDVQYYFIMGFEGDTTEKQFQDGIHLIYGLRHAIIKTEEFLNDESELHGDFKLDIPNPLAPSELSRLGEKVIEMEKVNAIKEKRHLKELIEKAHYIAECQEELIEAIKENLEYRETIKAKDKAYKKLETDYNKIVKKGGKNE